MTSEEEMVHVGLGNSISEGKDISSDQKNIADENTSNHCILLLNGNSLQKAKMAEKKNKTPSASIQSDSDNLAVEKKDDPVKVEELSEAPIDILNYDCLVYVFSFLTKQELIGIERVCKKWREVILGLWSTATTLHFKRDFNVKPFHMDHLKALLWRSGNYLTYLNLHSIVNEINAEQTLNLIGTYCTRLSSLDVSSLKINEAGARSIRSVVPNLKCLHMDYCDLTDKILALLLKKAVNLEELTISHNYDINGNSLISLSKKCRTLDVNYCNNIKKKVLVRLLRRLRNLEVLGVSCTFITPKILKPTTQRLTGLSLMETNNFFSGTDFRTLSFPCLQKLDVSYNETITDEMLDIITEICPMLVEIDISLCDSLTDRGIFHLTRLSKLTCLKANSVGVTSDFLEYLADSSKGRFKKLECRDSDDLTDAGPSRMVALSPELTCLDISDCPEMTEWFFKSALESLQLRTNKVPLKIHAHGFRKVDFSNYSHPLLKINNRSCRCEAAVANSSDEDLYDSSSSSEYDDSSDTFFDDYSEPSEEENTDDYYYYDDSYESVYESDENHHGGWSSGEENDP